MPTLPAPSVFPVRVIDLGIAVGAALVIVGAMRVVGLLLVAALMVLPVGAVRVVAPSFRATMFGSSALGGVSVIVGLWIAPRQCVATWREQSCSWVVAAVIVSGLARAANQRLQSTKHGQPPDPITDGRITDGPDHRRRITDGPDHRRAGSPTGRITDRLGYSTTMVAVLPLRSSLTG